MNTQKALDYAITYLRRAGASSPAAATIARHLSQVNALDSASARVILKELHELETWARVAAIGYSRVARGIADD